MSASWPPAAASSLVSVEPPTYLVPRPRSSRLHRLAWRLSAVVGALPLCGWVAPDKRLLFLLCLLLVVVEVALVAVLAGREHHSLRRQPQTLTHMLTPHRPSSDYDFNYS